MKLGNAAASIAPLYDRIFGQGMVSNHLKVSLREASTYGEQPVTSQYSLFSIWMDDLVCFLRLQNDIIGHGNGLAKAAEEDARYHYIDEMIPTIIKEK